MDVDANMGVKLTLRAGTGGLFTFEFTDVPGEGGGVVTFTHDTNMGGINPNDMEDFCNYDKTKDAFIPPKTCSSWVLDEDTCTWRAPKTQPDDGKLYKWDETITDWKEI